MRGRRRINGGTRLNRGANFQVLGRRASRHCFNVAKAAAHGQPYTKAGLNASRVKQPLNGPGSEGIAQSARGVLEEEAKGI
jgi:hypothetical protein